MTTRSPNEFPETRESEVIRKEESLRHSETVGSETNGNQTEKKMTVSPPTITHEKVQFNNSESKDMLETHVNPPDDDDETSEKASDKPQKDSNLNATTWKYSNDTGIFAPFNFPTNHSALDIRTATPEWYEKLKPSNYSTSENDTDSVNKTDSKPAPVLVVTMPSNSSAATEATQPPKTPAVASTEVGNTARTATATGTMTTVPTIDNENKKEFNPTTYRPTLSTPSLAEMKLHEKKIPVPEKMPTGVAALIAAISFAIVVVLTYIGLLVRKRYLEWRYGNRELLVNDFDAADMSNFEL
ncbi:uncharacterized protein [Venturia canescens]|nr:uncharacterized protein LOC122416064 isoform X2 [Venturia canescens]